MISTARRRDMTMPARSYTGVGDPHILHRVLHETLGSARYRLAYTLRTLRRTMTVARTESDGYDGELREYDLDGVRVGYATRRAAETLWLMATLAPYD